MIVWLGSEPECLMQALSGMSFQTTYSFMSNALLIVVIYDAMTLECAPTVICIGIATITVGFHWLVPGSEETSRKFESRKYNLFYDIFIVMVACAFSLCGFEDY
jgi:hypothetical protein